MKKYICGFLLVKIVPGGKFNAQSLPIVAHSVSILLDLKFLINHI